MIVVYGIGYPSEKKCNSMSPDEFRQHLREYERLAREMVFESGDPGIEPITKISGIPWWPEDLRRPRCDRGHWMSFIAQIRLSDVPTFENQDDALVSFHYCQQCTYSGNTSFGWDCPLGNTESYKVSVITSIHARQPDQLGTVAEMVIDPMKVSFCDVMDAPSYEDTLNSLNLSSCPVDYPQGADDFDKNIYPGVIHIANCKVGGWPSWVQSPNPPKTKTHERRLFLGQFDSRIGTQTAWCSGGYAYLFLISTGDQRIRGELSLQIS